MFVQSIFAAWSGVPYADDHPEARLDMIRCSCCPSCIRSALVCGAAGRDIVARLLLQQPHAAGSDPVFLDGARVGKHYQAVSGRYMLFLSLSSWSRLHSFSDSVDPMEYSEYSTCFAAVYPVSSAALPHVLSSSLTGPGTGGVLCATSSCPSMNVTEIIRTHQSYLNHIILWRQ